MALSFHFRAPYSTIGRLERATYATALSPTRRFVCGQRYGHPDTRYRRARLAMAPVEALAVAVPWLALVLRIAIFYRACHYAGRSSVWQRRRMRERHARGENVLDKARTLGQMLDDWIATMERAGKADNTLIAYRVICANHLKPRMGAVEVPKLRARGIQKVFNELSDQFASSTIRSIKTVLVAALNMAIEQDERSDNPAAQIRIPTVKPKKGRSLSPDEVRAVLIQCASHRYGLAVQFALMGLRRGEIPGLRWEDFNEQTGTLMIQRQIQRVGRKLVAIPPKDGSARMLSLGPKMTALLRQHRWSQAEERDAMGGKVAATFSYRPEPAVCAHQGQFITPSRRLPKRPALRQHAYTTVATRQRPSCFLREVISRRSPRSWGMRPQQ